MTALPLSSVWGDEVVFGANESPPIWSNVLQDSGLGGAIIQAMSKEANLQASIIFKPLSRLIDDDEGNDLGNPAFFLANQDYSAIIPIAVYQISLFYYAPNHKAPIVFDGIEDLKKYRIGILKGTLLDRSFFIRQNIFFAESYSRPALLKKLKLGRIDMVLEIDMIGHYMSGQLFPNERKDFKSIVLPYSSNPITMMLAEDTPADIAQKYRAALKGIIDNGTYQRILERYFGERQIPDDWFAHLNRFSSMYDSGGDR